MTGMLSAARRHVESQAFMPANWMPSLRAAMVLWRDYGHVKTVRSRTARDRNGNPLPWYTYPAIEFLRQLNFSDRTVFEYGAGMSTLYWAGAARRVVSVEDDESWFRVISERVPPNADVILETDLAAFPHAIERSGERYDVIVVDGPARGRTRLKCARAALRALKSGGLVILDNSDWLPESSRILREQGLLEVDMTGFAPVCGHVQTTSLFFDRAFNVPPLGDRQPMPGRGAQVMQWETPFVPVPGELIDLDDELFRGAANVQTFTLDAGQSVRSFKAFTYLGGDDSRCLGIVDLDNHRVLLSRHAPADTTEVERIAGMTWSQFRSFINMHDKRRYMVR